MKNLKKLPVKGITADEVLALWQAGRLYLEEDRTTGKENIDIEKEVRTYVSTIHCYVAPEWQPYINDLWQAIIKDNLFAPMLVMRKGYMQGHLNRYIVTNIVFHLKALDIYQCDNLLELHKKLEGVTHKNGIYKAAGTYCLSRAQRQRLRELKTVVAGQK